MTPEPQRNKLRRKHLADPKIHVRVKIAAAWAAIMFLYVYNDLFSLYIPGALQGVIGGQMHGFPPTDQGLLLVFAVSMIPPSAMVFLPLVLPAALARWVSVGVGIFYSVFVGWTLTMPDAWTFYIVLGAVEIALTLLTVWYALTWPKDRDDSHAS